MTSRSWIGASKLSEARTPSRRICSARWRKPWSAPRTDGVLGPVLGPDYSTLILLVQRLLDGAMPGCPKLYFGVVDVRDVADIHLRAMTDPAAKGERFLASAGDFMSMRDIAKVLKDRLGAAANPGF